MNIAQRMLAVMRDVGGIERTSSEGVSYKFRSIEQIAPVVQKALIEHGVIVLPVGVELLGTVERDRGEGKSPQRVVTLAVRYDFVNADDPADRLHAEMIGESADVGSKPATQALTFAYKCLWLQSLCIGDPTSDGDTMPEQDGERALLDWNASDDEIDALSAAVSMLDDDDRALMTAWWKRTEVGSLQRRHVNGRHVPAALSLVQTLIEQSDSERSTGDVRDDPT